MRHKALPSKRLLEEAFFAYVRNPIPGICPVRFCTRSSKSDRSLCHRHHAIKYRAEHPEWAAYKTLRDNAKTRGIVFTITFEQFMDVAKDFPFHKQKPKLFKDYLSIDRIEARRGYEPGNIQALTVSENAIKGNRLRYTPEGRYWQAKAEEAEEAALKAEEDVVPF